MDHKQSAYSTGTLCDATRELWDPSRIRGQIPAGPWQMGSPKAILGPAHTIRVRRATDIAPSPLEHFFTAIDSAPSGSVVVFEVIGDITGSTMGDAIATRLAKRGCQGVVVDGLVRDYAGILEVGLPTWVRGTRMEGMMPKLMKIEHGVDIRCGGVPVSPGDFVSGDLDGLFVIPQDLIDDVLAIAARTHEAETAMFALLEEGAALADVYQKTGRA